MLEQKIPGLHLHQSYCRIQVVTLVNITCLSIVFFFCCDTIQFFFKFGGTAIIYAELRTGSACARLDYSVKCVRGHSGPAQYQSRKRCHIYYKGLNTSFRPNVASLQRSRRVEKRSKVPTCSLHNEKTTIRASQASLGSSIQTSKHSKSRIRG